MQDVSERGLGLLLFPEWYSLDAMARMRFFDDNTRSWWTPATGGSNIPAVNDLAAPYGLAFGSTVLHGAVTVGAHKLAYASGTSVVRAPKGARLFGAQLQDTARAAATSPNAEKPARYDVLALLQHGAGRVAAFGDSNCIDANHATSNCQPLLLDMFRRAFAHSARHILACILQAKVQSTLLHNGKNDDMAEAHTWHAR